MKNKNIRIITLTLGILLTVYMIIFCILSNFNIGNIMSLFTGIFLIFIATLYPSIAHFKIVKAFKYLFIAGYTFLFAMIMFIAISANTNTADYKEDAVIVLGCGIIGERLSIPLVYRLNSAIEYANNSNCIIIVSGGQGPQESISEAEAMYRYLVANGVDKNRIIKEDSSTSTNENFKFSKQLLDNTLGTDYTVAYITNSFHTYRAGKLAQKYDLHAKSYPAKTGLSNLLPSYMREVLAVIQLWAFNI